MQPFSANYWSQVLFFVSFFSVMTGNSQKLGFPPKENFIEEIQNKAQLLPRVSCSRLSQGHGYHPRLFILECGLNYNHLHPARTHTQPRTHSWLTQYVNYTMTWGGKKEEEKKTHLKKSRLLFVTDVCIPGYIFKTLC